MRVVMECTNCDLCKSNKYTTFKEIDGYKLVKCSECGLVYLNPRPAQQELNTQYPAEYHIAKLLGREPKTECEIEEEINKNIGTSAEIVKQFGTRGKLLDIGCSAGFFIASLKRRGWDVTGIDISEWASRFAREKLGLDVLTGSLEEVRIGEQFDVITMYHILEHLPDPLKTLKRVLGLIVNSGVLIIKGPNLASFDRMWHGANWRGYDLPFHLYHFTPKTYSMILDKAGFTVQKIILKPWNTDAHLKEMRLGDGTRADHPPRAIERFNKSNTKNNFIFKGINKMMDITTKLLSLKGRDLTIYAKRRNSL